MSALKKEEKRLTKDINLIYDLTDKANRTNLTADKDRAVIAKLRADLVLPTNKILSVDIDFDSTSGYHNNTMLIMDDFGVEMLATAFETKYGKEYSQKVRAAWANKKQKNDPRKPTYMLVQKPHSDDVLPQVFVACGDKDHDPDTKNML